MDLQEGEFETQKRTTFQWTSFFSQADHQRTGTPTPKTATVSSQPYQFSQDPAATSKNVHPPYLRTAMYHYCKNSYAPPLQQQYT
eukprot:14232781-Ditylum_brightwellii.AAC.1